MKTELTTPSQITPASEKLGQETITRLSFQEKLSLPLKDTYIGAGLIFVIISAILFVGFEWLATNKQEAFTLFFIHYVIAFVYGFSLLIKWGWKFISGRSKQEDFTAQVLLWLVLSLISCYALNREMSVFDSATSWLCFYIVTSGIACIAFVWKDHMSSVLQSGLYVILAAALLLFVYLAIYLVPIYPIGAICMIGIGIGGHVFIPLIFSFILFRVLRESFFQFKKPILIGLALPLVFITYFAWHWQANLDKIQSVESQVISHTKSLPKWVQISQKLRSDWVTERILKTGLVYTPMLWENGFDIFPSRSFSEVQEHDPLVVIASTLWGRPDFSRSEKIQILESLHDARHEAQQRLWSGDDLATRHIENNVKVYPDYRLAYTEKIITIHNHSSWSWRDQEAIYTFHLPEGSVVTSLSLWINGIEEEARLTTKAKADSAYTTIVGVERRDPSVVQWQEGNTVTVRVFPCPANGDRQFKIGITSPLRAEGDRLFYDNIYFQGPTNSRTKENTSVDFVSAPLDVLGLEDFSSEANSIFYTKGSYQPDFSFSFRTPTLSKQSFVFQGKSYSVLPYQKQYEHFAPQSVYIDLNNSWSLREFEDVYDMTKSSTVWVWDEQWIQLTNTNLLSMYEKLWKNQFSLLPVHKIDNPEQSLIISKSDHPSPNLNDLKDTPFAKDLESKATQNLKVRLFSLSSELSPYLKTLAELRVIQYDRGSTTYLKQLFIEKRFVKNMEDEQTVTLPQAEIQLKEETTQSINANVAPDHLLRLFTYNHLMHEIGHRYFAKDYLSDNLIAEAQRAYVVSPISSLVVLETQKDYERFGIKEAKNSLKNASLNGAGSVPEPHEWLLILTAVSIAGYLFWRQRI
ncbi:XrtN system VIT domain-containing protein [Cytophagaceae bacterium YF14B1]|uniref:XrtN system VIT domain-containing protein n=1 Tax=Xanthocytophaga flava TaxID=3048013 RepID=A0AAE3QN29_9BACT|nr:XrtN system VIT domain-containing protein [Xanthocytophaga flavus]MDJ1480055.1 XrtN system VIT domain-containing protein [Xanthocytophaga flavus]